MFERRKPGFRALKALQGKLCRTGTNLAERRRLLAQLTNRLFVRLAEGFPFVFDELFQLVHAFNGMLLETILNRGPFDKTRLDFGKRVRVPLIDVGPSAQDFSAPLGEKGQLPLDWLGARPRFASLTDGERQSIDLRLEIGGRRFQASR